MTWIIVAAVCLVFALVPAILYARNVKLYVAPPPHPGPLPRSGGEGENPPPSAVSILIPARNESRSIGAAVEAALKTMGLDFEIVVLDDHSEDDTTAIVRTIAERDPRVRLENAPTLPPGWCGKQHACFALSKLARHPLLVFVDADVRLAPDGLARLVGFLESSNADLVSGFPKQETGTFLERLLIPLIHFLLLGFLPLSRMRKCRKPAYAAGCGQLFAIRREAYEKVGGHEAVKSSLHDGITLPRAFRQAGLMTDLCDATDLAVCRMYRSAGEVWFGLAKNAREGLAATKLIVPATTMLLIGQVAPFVMFFFFLVRFANVVAEHGPDFEMLISAFEQCGVGIGLAISTLAIMVIYYPRFDAVVRFRQPSLGALLHPFGIVMLLAIQWYALGRALIGKRSSWKGRHYLAS